MRNLYLNQKQLDAELQKCLKCPTKPCMHACPVHCSPRDFIAAAKNGNWHEAADLIYTQNPLGEVCGLVCPDKFCMKSCIRRNIDNAILIPQIQAAIMKKDREDFSGNNNVSSPKNEHKVAVIGLGPAGIGVIAELLKQGFQITAYEKDAEIGGALNLIPSARLPKEILKFEWQKLAANPLLETHFNTRYSDYENLLKQGFDAVVVAVGEQKTRSLNIVGEELAVNYVTYLKHPSHYKTSGHVMIVGGGAAAVDCALTATNNGSQQVEMIVRRRKSDMRITTAERNYLLENNINITALTRLTKIEKSSDKFTVHTVRTEFSDDGKLIDVADLTSTQDNISLIILALGNSRSEEPVQAENIFYAGDFVNGGSTAVEAIASGKAIAQQIIEKFA